MVDYLKLVIASEAAMNAQSECLIIMQQMQQLSDVLRMAAHGITEHAPTGAAVPRVVGEGAKALALSWNKIADVLLDSRELLARGYLASLPPCYCGKCDRDKQATELREALGVQAPGAMS